MEKTIQADLVVVGGGLAGSEAAWQAAERNLKVVLYEMRPIRWTGAHTGDYLAELVCSNSLGSNRPERAQGLLKDELRRLGSMVLECAEKTSVPAGSALAVDRQEFAKLVTRRILEHPNIRVIRQEICEIPDGLTVISSGPLTSPSLSEAISKWVGQDHLYFFDAIAPIVHRDSINMEIAFYASRYGRGEQSTGDYINCPLDQNQYDHFVSELIKAERVKLREFELELEQGVKAGAHKTFEGCLPIEIMAQRGPKTLAFGPLRPVGITNPHTGKKPYAVVQLRQDNLAGTLFNMVGFQTNLTIAEQKRIFRMIPGLEQAEFERFGQMHRNTFIFSPALLLPTLQSRSRANLFFAGQITGVEGYMGNIATGLLAGWNAARLFHGQEPITLPLTTMIGGLCHYITHADKADFQPMKANFGILPVLQVMDIHGKRARGSIYSIRAHQDLEIFLQSLGENGDI